MPLTLEELHEIQMDAIADDIPIELERMKLWSEDEARYYFENGGEEMPRKEAWTPPPPAAKMARADDAVMKKWFPKYKKVASGAPTFRVICFHFAGGAESVWTGRAAALKNFCDEKGGELLACELPGRQLRMKEPRETSVQPYAEALYPILAPLFQDGTPYVLMGHSVGTWLMYELLRLLLERGVPMPKQLVISCFPGPNIPVGERPWKPCRGMNDADFQVEAREWDVNEVVFQPANWGAFGGMMRDDFKLFDEYEFSPPPTPLPVPVQAYFATRDQKVKRRHVEMWRVLCGDTFELEETGGNHLFFYDYPQCNKWMERVISKAPLP